MVGRWKLEKDRALELAKKESEEKNMRKKLSCDACGAKGSHSTENCRKKNNVTHSEIEQKTHHDAPEQTMEPCSVCQKTNHRVENCRFACRNNACKSQPVHNYKECNHRLCKTCYDNHGESQSCDFGRGRRYIVNAYRKNYVCECSAVAFWKSCMGSTMRDYVGSSPFFSVYEVPRVYKYCQNPVKCEHELSDGKQCGGHHYTQDHGYFF